MKWSFLLLALLCPQGMSRLFRAIKFLGKIDSYAILDGTVGRALNSFTLCFWSQSSVDNMHAKGMFSYMKKGCPECTISIAIRHNKFGNTTKTHFFFYNNDKWLHTCFMWSGSSNESKIFANGQDIHSSKIESPHVVKQGGMVVLGQSLSDVSNENFAWRKALNGYISEIYFWNGLLSKAEISALYNCVYYKFRGAVISNDIIDWKISSWKLKNVDVSSVYIPCGQR